MRYNQVLCQLSVKPKANVSCRLILRRFVSCQLKFWPFVSCQLIPSTPSFKSTLDCLKCAFNELKWESSLGAPDDERHGLISRLFVLTTLIRELDVL